MELTVLVVNSGTKEGSESMVTSHHGKQHPDPGVEKRIPKGVEGPCFLFMCIENPQTIGGVAVSGES